MENTIQQEINGMDNSPFYYVLLNPDGKIESGFQQKDLILNIAQLQQLGYQLIPLYRKDNACLSPLECIGKTRCIVNTQPISDQPLIYRLRKRAEIRRQIPVRTSVMENKPDKIANLLEEAANEIETLRKRLLS